MIITTLKKQKNYEFCGKENYRAINSLIAVFKRGGWPQSCRKENYINAIVEDTQSTEELSISKSN